MLLSKATAIEALAPAAVGLDAAFVGARKTSDTMIAAADVMAFDPSVRGNVIGTLVWAAFASAAVGPMALVGERDLGTSPQSRMWTVKSADGPFKVQMKSDIDEIREEQLSLFAQDAFADAQATREERVILTWNAIEPRFVLMRSGHVAWSIPVASLAAPADVVAAGPVPKRSVASKSEDVAASRDRKSS